MSEVEAAPRPKLVVTVPCVCMLAAWSKFQDGNLVGCPAARGPDGPTGRIMGRPSGLLPSSPPGALPCVHLSRLLYQSRLNLAASYSGSSEHHSIDLTASFPYPACKGVLLFQPSAIQLVLRGQFNQQYKQYEGNRGQFNRTRDLALATTDALGHQFWWLYTTGGQNWLQPPATDS